MAVDGGSLPGGAAGRIQAVIDRLPELCGPEEPPARLHGDLWSGNVMSGPDGAPWLVDPAAYGGHREIDLAMLRLFGSPPPAFFAAYEEVASLADGHEDRVDLYQLLPLLVHAVLFGGGYGAAAARAAGRDALWSLRGLAVEDEAGGAGVRAALAEGLVGVRPGAAVERVVAVAADQAVPA